MAHRDQLCQVLQRAHEHNNLTEVFRLGRLVAGQLGLRNAKKKAAPATVPTMDELMAYLTSDS